MANTDETLLTSDERKRFHHRRFKRTRHRDFWMGYVAMVFWGFTVVLLLVLLERVDTTAGSPEETFTLVLLLPLMLAGWIPAVWVGNRQAAASRRRRTKNLLNSNKVQDRAPRTTIHGRSDRSDDGPHYWATGNYDPERYYRETSGWSKDYRDYVKEAYGDLDTYESNKPD